MLTKKREALVKLELASKNEKLPQAQEEVKEVQKYCQKLHWAQFVFLVDISTSDNNTWHLT